MDSHIVLVVEDNDDVREVLGCLLRAHGFQVREAANGREALDLLTSEIQEPCLVLLDLMMPVMSGWQLLAELDETSCHTSSEVIIISAVADRAAHPEEAG
jgi:CheY-like chemotaxis protein